MRFQILDVSVPFSIKYKIHCEVRVATGSDPLIDEHVHVFTSYHEDRASE